MPLIHHHYHLLKTSSLTGEMFVNNQNHSTIKILLFCRISQHCSADPQASSSVQWPRVKEPLSYFSTDNDQLYRVLKGERCPFGHKSDMEGEREYFFPFLPVISPSEKYGLTILF